MCDCISNVSNMLREQNASLVTTMFANPERVVLFTQKIDAKKRGKPPCMVATCCPFCGERYARAPEVTETERAAANPEAQLKASVAALGGEAA